MQLCRGTSSVFFLYYDCLTKLWTKGEIKGMTLTALMLTSLPWHFNVLINHLMYLHTICLFSPLHTCISYLLLPNNSKTQWLSGLKQSRFIISHKSVVWMSGGHMGLSWAESGSCSDQMVAKKAGWSKVASSTRLWPWLCLPAELLSPHCHLPCSLVFLTLWQKHPRGCQWKLWGRRCSVTSTAIYWWKQVIKLLQIQGVANGFHLMTGEPQVTC